MSDLLNTSAIQNKQDPLILKLSGSVIDSPDSLEQLCKAIVHLHKNLSNGLIVIHGGGAAVDKHLTRLGLISNRIDGIRITPTEHIQEIVGVLAGSVNKKLVGQLQQCGANAVGLCLGDGFLAKTSKVAYETQDPGCVGEVIGGNPLIMQSLLSAGFLPVLASIGIDEKGQPLNVNADTAAAGIANVVNACRLVFLTDTQGVLDLKGMTIANLSPSEIESKIQTGEIKGGMAAKVRSAAIASTKANIPVTIASFNDPAALKSLEYDKLIGTQIMPAITPATAIAQDNSP